MKFRKILYITSLCFFSLAANAQEAKIDRDWYLAGEAINVEVTVPDALIAYAEICDTHALGAGTIISLADGKGVGAIELPSTLHSGYYRLSVYARGGKKAWSCLVPVVNIMYKNADDDITWEEATGDKSTVSAQHPYTLSNTSLSIPEREGHIVMAHVTNSYGGRTYGQDNILPSLSIVGKQVHYFEGKMVNDSTALFFTNDVYGKQPLVISATTLSGDNLPIQIITPYACMIPAEVPHLVFNYSRAEVEERSKEMQLHQIAITPTKKELVIGEKESDDATVEAEPMPYNNIIFSKAPDLSYNLDEYRQFATIKETLIEYVRCVHRMSFRGVPQLAVFNDEEGYADWPAMVFIDGMPVHDVERVLNYDARRLHYINIYEDRYTFGGNMYKGILSFVTRTGRLTNYPTEPNVSYLVYEFPK